MIGEFDLVIGDEWIAFYKDGRLAAQGKLTWGDILDICEIPCYIHEVDLEWIEQRGGKMPDKLNDVKMADLDEGEQVV